jgi:hypothetical protein
MNFPIKLNSYNISKIDKINKYITIATYTKKNTNKNIVYIYNSKDTNYILLYNTTLYNIYNILNMNKKIYNNPSPKGSPLKTRKASKKIKKELT